MSTTLMKSGCFSQIPLLSIIRRTPHVYSCKTLSTTNLHQCSDKYCVGKVRTSCAEIKTTFNEEDRSKSYSTGLSHQLYPSAENQGRNVHSHDCSFPSDDISDKWISNALESSSRASSTSIPSTSCPTTVDLVITQPSPVLLLLKHYSSIAAGLSKARLSGLVVSTALVGCGLAASTSLVSPEFLEHCYRTTCCLAVGTMLTSSAANSVNQIIEIPYDSQMTRTKNRVLVRGLTTPGRAALFALACSSSGLGLLYFGVNPLVAELAAMNMLLYTCIYTPMKQVSHLNTWIGAWVGAIPPLMGWAAATGQLQCGSIMLASLLYVWQFPHFMALSWNMRGEYSKAGYTMTSIVDPEMCKRVALRHAIASSLVCLAGAGCSAISLGPWAGCALGIGSLPANIGLIYYAWKFAYTDSSSGTSLDAKCSASSAAARRLFRATLFHLPVVMLTVLVGAYCSINSGHA